MGEGIIRLAKAGEEAAIHAAHMRSIREICVNDHGEEEIRGWGFRDLGNRWVDAIKNGDVWVVEKDGAIHGFGCLHLSEEDEKTKAYLDALYLIPEALGKKFGARLMALMLDKAKAAGAVCVDLDSTITAHKFYEAFGFVDAGPMKRIEIGGHPVTAFPMRLQL